jgi:hypothetical protein
MVTPPRVEVQSQKKIIFKAAETYSKLSVLVFCFRQVITQKIQLEFFRILRFFIQTARQPESIGNFGCLAVLVKNGEFEKTHAVTSRIFPQLNDRINFKKNHPKKVLRLIHDNAELIILLSRSRSF